MHFTDFDYTRTGYFSCALCSSFFGVRKTGACFVETSSLHASYALFSSFWPVTKMIIKVQYVLLSPFRQHGDKMK